MYSEFFKNMRDDMENNREKFEAMSILAQTKLLLEILKAFKCNAQNADFSELCGKGTVGRIAKSKTISKLESAVLVSQSITGLYETRTNLLK